VKNEEDEEKNLIEEILEISRIQEKMQRTQEEAEKKKK